MPKKNAPRLALAYGWTLGEGPWNTDMDINMKLIDTLLGGGTMISNTVTTPPDTGGAYSDLGPANGTDTQSTSGYAWKGNILLASQNSSISSVTARIYITDTTVQYKAAVATPSGTAATGTLSSAPVFSQVATASATGWQTISFYFSTPVPVVSGSRYAVMIGAIGKGAAFALALSAPTTASFPTNAWFTMPSIVRCAADPIASGTAYDTLSLTTVPFIIRMTGSAGGGLAFGDAYIVPASATGAWAGKTNQIAFYVDGAWQFIVPKRGLRVEVQSASAFMWFNGTAWVAETANAGIPDAPSDSNAYVRKNASWQRETLSSRNGFIDGNFDFWSLGTSTVLGAGQGAYVTDMWCAYVSNVAGAAATVSQVPVPPETPPSASGAPRKFNVRWSQTGAGGGVFYQRLEDVRQYAGKSVTLSCRLSASAAGNWISQVKANQNFGSGGSPSPTTFSTLDITWNLTSTEALFSVRIDVPSIVGKTIGTDENSFIEFQFQMATAGTYDVNFGQAQIEVCDPSSSDSRNGDGGAPTPFEHRGLALEKQRVSRYFQVHDTNNTALAWGTFYSTTAANITGPLPGGPMRTAPGLTISNTYNVAGVGTVSGTAGVSADTYVFSNNVTGISPAGTIGSNIVQYGTLIADARF